MASRQERVRDRNRQKEAIRRIREFFQETSGIEPILDKIDKETDKAKLKALVNELDTKKTNYVKSLKQHQVDSTNQNYKVEIDRLLIKLEDLNVEAFDKYQRG